MTDLLTLTADVAAAYLSKNRVAAEELPGLLKTIHEALARAEQGLSAEPERPKLTPAEIRKSVTPEALISFEDGKPYRMLRRHLRAQGFTPADYRAKWGLPKDYPMVAPAYSERRSAMAKAAGLGRTTGRTMAKAARKVAEVVKDAAEEVLPDSGDDPAPEATKRGRGRPPKAKS